MREAAFFYVWVEGLSALGMGLTVSPRAPGGLWEDTVSSHQGLDGGFASAETFVKFHRRFGTALFEDVLAERRSRLLVEYASLLEQGEGVGIEYLCPFVTVISGSVSA